MRKIKILIIDSGVRKNHPSFWGDTIQEITYDGSSIEDEFGHGTAIYNIIRECKDIAEIYNMKLNGIENGAEEAEIIKALTYIKDMDFDLINMSFGINICDNYNILSELCKEIHRKGTILVSAFDNSQSISFPAAFPEVIGVTGGYKQLKKHEFVFIEDDIVNLIGKEGIFRVAWTSPDYMITEGNSFVCAYAAVEIAKLMASGITEQEEILKQFQKKEQDSLDKDKSLFSIKKAAIFPFNKEMHGLIRFYDMLSFEITDIFDSKYSENIGRKTTEILEDMSVKEIEIKNIVKIEWDKIDCLILGHLDELFYISRNEKLKEEIIKKAIENHVNIYSFDDISSYIPEKRKSHVFYPCVSKQDLPPYRMGKLYRYSKPIVGVFGTSPRQGKFTVQMKIRKEFQRLGYKVGQIGTEPSALLYGIDYVFPMGYHSSVFLNEYDTIRYLNNILFQLMKKETDLVIVGSQSGTIPYDMGNINQYTIPQYVFLNAVQPDIVILCVNPYDEIEYINRTIQFIEAAVDTKVIGLVMFPMDLKNDWTGKLGKKYRLTEAEWNEKKIKLKEECKKEVYNLDYEDDFEELINRMIEFYS